jgi:N-acetylated-alpha-linked acidic dipeptidase
MHPLQRFSIFMAAAAFAIAAGQSTAAPASAASLYGFMTEGVAAQLTLEQRFDKQLNAAEIGEWLKRLSSAANHVGAPHDKENAEFVRQQFRDWGWQAEIETFDVLYPTPKRVALELVAPTKYVAKLFEPAIAGDATSTLTDHLPPYNIYGADGDVTGDLVYVNQGMEDDYKELARRGVDVKGKIVITRYGGGWRGLKPKLAYQHGAIGCLIYSDPKDDGYAKGETYPAGGWRPADGVQRGSVADMPIYPGDPLTPGVGATKNAKRLPLAEAKTLLKIPVMPISYADARPLLEALMGQVAPESWRGSLPITYHIGPGPARVHLTIESDWSLKPLYNVIAKIPGTTDRDEWIVRGNHRDGWVFGAWDPLSGTVAMMAEAKAIGVLLKTGWKPKRTIVYASWDGEEPGLLGSTEWVETHAEELQRKVVLYLNSDTNTRGFLNLDGSHSLQRFANEVASGVKDPETGATAQERMRARMMVEGYPKTATEEKKKLAKKAGESGDVPLAALGSGSDYTPFIQHLGVTTLGVYYEGEDDQDGVYHSLYDSYDHYACFGDPGFVYGVAEAQTAGRVVLRMANADVLPLQFGGFADTVADYLQEVHKLADDKRKSAEDLAKLIDQKAFALAADPTRPVLAPEREPEVPYFNLAPLDNIVARLKRSAKAYDEAYTRLAVGEIKLTPSARNSLNKLLQGMERALTNERGLPGRSWYRHLIYAPGLLTGYGVKTLPGVREAIEQKHWDQANEYSELTAQALAVYCDRLDKATVLLNAQTGKFSPQTH